MYGIVLSLLIIIILIIAVSLICLKYSHSSNRTIVTEHIDTRLNPIYNKCRMDSSGHLEMNHQIASSRGNKVVVEPNRWITFDNHGNRIITGHQVQAPPTNKATSRHSGNTRLQPSSTNDDGFVQTANPNGINVMPPNIDPADLNSMYYYPIQKSYSYDYIVYPVNGGTNLLSHKWSSLDKIDNWSKNIDMIPFTIYKQEHNEVVHLYSLV